jgi:hypothetical protein
LKLPVHFRLVEFTIFHPARGNPAITVDIIQETAMEHINHLLDNLKCQSGKATAA